MTAPEITFTARRQQRHAVLARAAAAELESLWQPYGSRVQVTALRATEAGMVMLRGLIGGNGAPFNFGEATVSRAAVRVMPHDAAGEHAVGIGYVLGRDRRHAELVALFDALAQVPRFTADVDAQVIAPLAQAHVARQDDARRATAASRVDFFTLVRGET